MTAGDIILVIALVLAYCGRDKAIPILDNINDLVGTWLTKLDEPKTPRPDS